MDAPEVPTLPAAASDTTPDLPTSSVADTSPDPDNPDTLPPLWHEDGDIILTVLAIDKTYRFRVHTVVLRLQSPVFKDMFQLAKGNPPAEGADCQSVTLHDPVDDVRVFLHALYQGLALLANPDVLTFDGALALLRLSHKYQVRDLQDGVIQLLKESWPLDQSDYRSESLGEGVASQESILKCIKLINTARLTNVPVLLPTAFYELAHSNFDAWDPDTWAKFSPDDSLRLMKGKRNIIRRIATLCNTRILQPDSIPILWNANPEIKANILSCKRLGCDPRANPVTDLKYSRVYYDDDGPTYCAGVFQAFRMRFSSQLINGDSLLYAMSEPESESGIDSFDTFVLQPELETVCTSCMAWMKVLVTNKKEEIWHNVPVDFDLPAIDPAEYLRQDGPRRRLK